LKVGRLLSQGRKESRQGVRQRSRKAILLSSRKAILLIQREKPALLEALMWQCVEELGKIDGDVTVIEDFAEEELHYFHALIMHLEVVSRSIC